MNIGNSPETQRMINKSTAKMMAIIVSNHPQGFSTLGIVISGWLMVDGEMQGRGIGSGIFADVRAAMKAAGYDYMALAVVKENEEALKFWKDQGFKVKKESVSTDGYEVYVMDRDI